METALIFFTKAPILNHCKTRLAPCLKASDLLELVDFLIKKNYKEIKKTGYDLFVYLANDKGKEIIKDMLNEEIYLQEGDDLGERMHNAFLSLFEKGYKKIILMGSDIANIDKELIIEASNSLDKVDMAVSPTRDGGYSLIALKKAQISLFANKIYSTDKVFKDLIDSAKDIKLTYKVLRETYDIDEKSDLIYFLENSKNLEGLFPSRLDQVLKELKSEK